jgi:hypothetical protein
MSKPVMIKNVYVSTVHRDVVKYPDPASFTIFLPSPIKGVFAVRLRRYKFVPQPLINKNSNTLQFTIDGESTGNVTLTKGDYSIDDLLTEVNNVMNAHGVHFSIDPVTSYVSITFTSAAISSEIYMPACQLLYILGFPSGVWLHRPGDAPNPPPGNAQVYENVASGSLLPSDTAMSDMIIRIADLEAITASDSFANRATTVLCASRAGASVVGNNDQIPFDLLQVQHRVQTLRVSMLDVNGNPYDIAGDVSFILEFHCYAETA